VDVGALLNSLHNEPNAKEKEVFRLIQYVFLLAFNKNSSQTC